jgi:hypothetical protein
MTSIRTMVVMLVPLFAASCGQSVGHSPKAPEVDYVVSGITEAEYFDDLTSLSRASDLAIEATVASIELSDLTFPGIDEPFAVAEITLRVTSVFGQSGVGPVAAAGGDTRVFWSLNGVSTAERDLQELAAVLPTAESWWFLRSRPGLGGEYRVVSTVSVLEETADGWIRPSLYRGSAQLVRIGASIPPTEHGRFLEDVVRLTVDGLRAALRNSSR